MLQHAVISRGSLQRASLSRPQEVVKGLHAHVQNYMERARTAEQQCANQLNTLTRIVEIANEQYHEGREPWRIVNPASTLNRIMALIDSEHPEIDGAGSSSD